MGVFSQGAAQVPLYQNESLRTSAAVALSHVCRLAPKLFSHIFNKITPRYFVYTLSEGQPRVQQAFISILNQALASPPKEIGYPKLNEVLLRLDSQAMNEDQQQQQQQ